MTDTKTIIAGVRFPENWKVYDFDATDVDIAVGDKVIVDSDRGPSFAIVARVKKTSGPETPAAPEEAAIPEIEAVKADADGDSGASPASPAQVHIQKDLRKILRKATEDDLARQDKNRAREAEAFSIAQEMIAGRELPMKLIRAEYSFDASRVTFFFFSENRVDFRDLVKDLAFKLKSRIELRQIGVRDVARMVGGFGPCGRELCCSSHLRNFEPVSIRMAKKQEMVLNPAKISGVCGRLLCCLSYEFGMYDEIKKDLAGMREAAVKEKRAEEELRITAERKETEERRAAEEKRRQEGQRQQDDKRREKQKEDGQKSGRPGKKRDQQQAKQTQQRPSQETQAKGRQHPQKPLKEQPKEQPKELPQESGQEQLSPQQEGNQEKEKAGKKKKRKFWRKKKKGPQQGEGGPPGPAS